MKRMLITSFLSVLLATSAMASTVVLTWDANTDATLAGYKVYYSLVNTQPFAGTGATQGAAPVMIAKGTTTATLSGLDSTKAYFFAVTAYNTQGMESVYSNIVSVPAFPVAPANVRFIAISP